MPRSVSVLFVAVLCLNIASAQEKPPTSKPPASGGFFGGLFGSGPKTPEQLDREAEKWIKSFDGSNPPYWVEARKVIKEQPDVGVLSRKLKWDEVKKMVDGFYEAGALRVSFDVPGDFGDQKVVTTMYVVVGGKPDVRGKVLKLADQTDKRLTELGCEGYMPKREPKPDDVQITLILQ